MRDQTEAVRGETWSSATKNKSASPLAAATLQQELGPTPQATHSTTHTVKTFTSRGFTLVCIFFSVCFLNLLT